MLYRAAKCMPIRQGHTPYLDLILVVWMGAVNRHRTVMNLGEKIPGMTSSTFVAPSASVIGDVKIGAGSSIWYGTILRGETSISLTSILQCFYTIVPTRSTLYPNRINPSAFNNALAFPFAIYWCISHHNVLGV